MGADLSIPNAIVAKYPDPGVGIVYYIINEDI